MHGQQFSANLDQIWLVVCFLFITPVASTNLKTAEYKEMNTKNANTHVHAFYTQNYKDTLQNYSTQQS